MDGGFAFFGFQFYEVDTAPGKQNQSVWNPSVQVCRKLNTKTARRTDGLEEQLLEVGLPLHFRYRLAI